MKANTIKNHLAGYTTLLLAAFALIPQVASAASNAPSLVEDYRVFCGYLDAKKEENIAKLSEKKQNKKIAKMAKTSVKKLNNAIGSMQAFGATCEDVGVHFEKAIKTSLPKSINPRIDVLRFDASDPSHVLVSVRFKGIDKKKVIQEASLLAQSISKSAPIVKTIAIRTINPRVKDPSSFEALWFEARIGGERAGRIDKKKVKDYANRRYIRLFDGVQCGKALVQENVLGGRGGPCLNKEAVDSKKEVPITK